ncbi:UDP-N-acetylmuramoyl-tripeptide--D-alanyl-D-alanine ligase [candidate division WOR-3 bacterium]|nr:UDP-N-acetylmuramoyl-tripeptide--D-alanyl-D-alanine ligase [candidate division WOR-3 bacterium]
MEPITIKNVLKAINGSLLNSQLTTHNSQFIKGVSIDSRTVSPGELFVALKGNKYDGHSFLEQAKQKGAIAAIVQIPNPSAGSDGQSPIPSIVVKDTLIALGDLADWYRNLFSIPIIGITGSNGKTTTKELTAKCLSTKYRVLKNEKSFNSLTGVPLTLFNLSKSDEVCVLEIGANHPGEIERLALIAKPSIGVITNIAPTHLENFKTIEGVLEEKLQLLDTTEISILNADDPLLSQRQDAFKFGINNGDLRAELLESTNGTRFKVQGVLFELPLVGKYQVYNALAAISVGIHSNLELQEMSEALKEVTPVPHREEIINFNGIKIIDSTYNANPVSMRLAIEELKRYSGRKVAILGDMLELGENASQFHLAIGKTLKEFGVQIIIGVGELAKGYVNGNRVDEKFHFKSTDLLLEELENIIKPGDVILIKGSHAIGMDRIVESLKLKI